MLRRNDPRDKIIEALLKQNADLLDRLQEMIGQIHYHQMNAHTPEGFDTRPLSEVEEDVKHMRQEGHISEAEAEEWLRDLGIEDVEIDLGD